MIPFNVGLTGGIGSGKSTVAALFENWGVTVIDADTIAHTISAPGEPGYQVITELFGADILQPNGQINRTKLREAVFTDPTKKQQLESSLHPMIRQAMYTQADASQSPYTILSIPLLTETQQLDRIDRILVVDCPETLQVARAMQRDQQSEEQVKRIMASQNDRKTRLEYADDVILNDGDLEALSNEVDALHALYLQLAAR